MITYKPWSLLVEVVLYVCHTMIFLFDCPPPSPKFRRFAVREWGGGPLIAHSLATSEDSLSINDQQVGEPLTVLLPSVIFPYMQNIAISPFPVMNTRLLLPRATL
jgi:hypothetical protein